jgi:nucleotide-binding universal stress UspA family protein
MLEKILLYIDESEAARTIAPWVLKLAKILNARIFAVFVITELTPKKQAQKTKLKSSAVNSKREEAAWATLYEVEDDAFEENVKISLILEEGKPEERLLEVLHSFELDGMIVSSQSKLDFKELISRCQGRVLIIK